MTFDNMVTRKYGIFLMSKSVASLYNGVRWRCHTMPSEATQRHTMMYTMYNTMVLCNTVLYNDGIRTYV